MFYTQVRNMVEAILGDKAAPPDESAACQPPAGQAVAPIDALLDVTMTDVVGEPRRFLDCWGQALVAREYRTPFRFRRDDDFTVRNLATAARASASFPVAFEPFRVVSDGKSDLQTDFTGARYAVDGGLLENAPIDAAIRLIPTRTASCQTKRFVCYVNAAPPTAEEPPEDPTEPDLASVLGYVVNVPRDGRFVDQLYAVEAARRRAAVARSAATNLFTLPFESLSAIANALLETYRRRRLLIALEDLLQDSAAAESVFEQVGNAAIVPWVPTSLDPPATAADWHWGTRAAERLLHFELDLLAAALPRPEAELTGDELASTIAQRKAVLETRSQIYAGLVRLAPLRDVSLAMVRTAIAKGFEPLAALNAGDAAFRQPVFAAVTEATEAFVAVVPSGLLGDPAAPGTTAASIVGDGGGADESAEASTAAAADGTTSSPVASFVQRALAIEVVRRAFSTEEDIETGQQLLFAQLTPLAPTRILARNRSAMAALTVASRS